MGRTPKAKNQVLDAARRIVRERGAGNLTFEEIVQQSGVTRGGITYHFATKDALLRALVESDIEQWRELEERHRPEATDPQTAELIADIRGHTERNDDRRRFVAGMLSALTLDPSLLDPVREFIAQKLAGLEWDDVQLRRHLLRLAAEGLFWSEIFEYRELDADVRERLVALMEQMARETEIEPEH
ncbi:MAG: TetR/AcrR family transcriptional regulator [Gammaproteobacteria bacterium]|nr:TetR/AcrR family transcriptional regulator [Gammaproteobacteria bacterium]